MNELSARARTAVRCAFVVLGVAAGGCAANAVDDPGAPSEEKQFYLKDWPRDSPHLVCTGKGSVDNADGFICMYEALGKNEADQKLVLRTRYPLLFAAHAYPSTDGAKGTYAHVTLERKKRLSNAIRGCHTRLEGFSELDAVAFAGVREDLAEAGKTSAHGQRHCIDYENDTSATAPYFSPNDENFFELHSGAGQE